MGGNVRNMVVGSIVLILASMYGGDSLGSWFVVKVDVEDDNTNEFRGGTMKYYLTKRTAEYEYDGDAPDDTPWDYSRDYDNNRCADFGDDCDELTGLMVVKIKNLLYLAILAGLAALYFFNEDEDEKGAMACLSMGCAGLLAIAMFGLSFPEALEDDTGTWSVMASDLDADPSLFGTENEEEDGVELSVSWRPDIAFALVFLSGILGVVAYWAQKDQVR